MSETSRNKPWEHAAEWTVLLGSAALAAVAVLPGAGVPRWGLWVTELVASLVAVFVTWAITGHGRLTFAVGTTGLFYTFWTAWALHGTGTGTWYSPRAIFSILLGTLVLWALLGSAWAAWGRREAGRGPRALGAAQEEHDPENEERARFEYMFSRVDCEGVQVTGIAQERSGRALRLVLPRSGKVTIDTLENAVRRIEVILRLKPGAVRFETGDNSGDIIMRLREREVLVQEMQKLTPRHYARTINEEFAVGIDEIGGVTKITLQGLHMFLVGATGMGKSNLLNVIIAQLARCPDTLIWVIDMKYGRTARPWIAAWARGETQDPAIDWVATTRDEASLMINAFKTAVEARAKSGKGGSKITPSASTPQIILICDEMAGLFSQKTSGKKSRLPEGATSNQEFIELSEEVTQLGRSEACSSAWATQRGTANFSGSGNLKANCMMRIALGAATEGDLQYVIPDAKASRKQLAYMGSTPGVGLTAITSNVSGLTRFFWHDHPEVNGQSLCYDGDSPDRCVPECPVYQSSMEVGRVRPALDRITAERIGEVYANRWRRVQEDPDSTLLPGGQLPAGAVGIASVDTSDFEEIMRRGGIKDGESNDHPARIRYREMLAARKAFGASTAQLMRWLKEEGLEVARETLQRWMRADSQAGLVHNPDYGRWKIGPGHNEWQTKGKDAA